MKGAGYFSRLRTVFVGWWNLMVLVPVLSAFRGHPLESAAEQLWMGLGGGRLRNAALLQLVLPLTVLAVPFLAIRRQP